MTTRAGRRSDRPGDRTTLIALKVFRRSASPDGLAAGTSEDLVERLEQRIRAFLAYFDAHPDYIEVAQPRLPQEVVRNGITVTKASTNILAVVTLEPTSADFPRGVSYRIPYDTTYFITASMKEVIKTLLEAVALVLVVVFVFLQSWRATQIPLLAVPVAVIGTFAGMLVLGFSINTLTLFGLVLAIGIVVDDAIVVAENVERIGVALLAVSSGAGAAAHRSIGTGVIGGMLAATFLAIFFVPVFFVLIQRGAELVTGRRTAEAAEDAEPEAVLTPA